MSARAASIVGAAIALVAAGFLVYHFALASPEGPKRVELILQPVADEGSEATRLPISDNAGSVLLRLRLPKDTTIERHRVEISAAGSLVWEAGSTLPEGQREIEVELPVSRLGSGRHDVVVVRERKRRQDEPASRYAFSVERK